VNTDDLVILAGLGVAGFVAYEYFTQSPTSDTGGWTSIVVGSVLAALLFA
jgi:hypothetical protein